MKIYVKLNLGLSYSHINKEIEQLQIISININFT